MARPFVIYPELTTHLIIMLFGFVVCFCVLCISLTTQVGLKVQILLPPWDWESQAGTITPDIIMLLKSLGLNVDQQPSIQQN